METSNERVEARPLAREGSYRIALAPGDNPIPDRAVDGEALARYYQELLAALESLARAKEEALMAGHADRKYRLKIALKCTEAVAALLHEVVESSAPFVCDRGCPHVRRPLAPLGCKAFLDALDVATAALAAQHAETDRGHVTWEDEVIELQVNGRWRSSFAVLLGGSRRG